MKKIENAKIYKDGAFIVSDLVFDEKVVGFTGDAEEVINIPNGAVVVPGLDRKSVV